ncbi:hypothetical protein PHET_05129 [Paragonimus heterotremus]|uniref:Uncharacterized protein n=1 Tax=Paragonimus heterotremus TaxID=100268 RepID=A0A8J4WRR2_9TREM|nr:hypothetical protein PHET_05129 [Paragonimus heterotremus]
MIEQHPITTLQMLTTGYCRLTDLKRGAAMTQRCTLAAHADLARTIYTSTPTSHLLPQADVAAFDTFIVTVPSDGTVAPGAADWGTRTTSGKPGKRTVVSLPPSPGTAPSSERGSDPSRLTDT